VFVSHAATLDVSFEAALARLAGLSGNGVLTRVSADAYAAGAPPGVPWLARSRFRNLITRPGRAVLAVRWETGGHYGEPFPVLDADLTLTPAGLSAAMLELSGIYRADLGEDGPRMGTVILGGFVDRIAETITRAGTATG
jgi:hypothetical protein